MVAENKEEVVEYIEDTAEDEESYPVQLGAMTCEMARELRRSMSLRDLEKLLIREEQVDCPVIHHFSPGLYIRELHMPKGCLAIGHRQRYEHMNLFLRGRITMFNDAGDALELVAPMKFVAGPGQKCGFVNEDVVWLNVYSTDERDVETLENTYMGKDDIWNREYARREKLLPLRAGDRLDYHKALAETGMREEDLQIRDESVVPLPFGSYKIAVFGSKIHGKGVFATAPIGAGEVIAPAKLGHNYTTAGRYVNHSQCPNAVERRVNGDSCLVALRGISGCQGGFLGEEIVTDYRNTMRLIGGTP